MINTITSMFADTKKTYKELQKIQEKQLRNIINHVNNNVYYYKKIFKKHRIKPKDIKKLEDLKKIPLLSRMDILTNYPYNITSGYTDIKNAYKRSTSGSTGTPITVIFDKNSIKNYEAAGLRSLLITGHNIFDKIAYLWYPPFNKERIYEKFGILKKVYISVNDKTKSIVKKLEKVKPETIYCYPSVLLELAKFISNENHELNIKRIISQGELLTSNVRKFVECKFGCEIFDHYGTTEFYIVASECKMHNGMHINMENIILEIENNQNEIPLENNSGNIIISGLVNKAMPLIRYKIGDIGSINFEKCSCGLEFPRINLIEGRDDDFIQLPSGKVIGPRKVITNLYSIFTFTNKINKFKIVQSKINSISIYITPGKEFNEKTIEDFETTLRKIFAESMDIEFKIRKNMPKNSHGKLRTIESKLKMKE